MDAKTLKALRGSIEKWKKIERSTRALDKTGLCPLCVMFEYFHCAEGCPVYKKTDISMCQGSPYMDWLNHQMNEHQANEEEIRRVKDCPTCLKLATAERKFLESLLPKGEKP